MYESLLFHLSLTASAKHGYRLENMRQRAASVGGMLRVESTLGNGTTVSVEVPVVK